MVFLLASMVLCVGVVGNVQVVIEDGKKNFIQNGHLPCILDEREPAEPNAEDILKNLSNKSEKALETKAPLSQTHDNKEAPLEMNITQGEEAQKITFDENIAEFSVDNKFITIDREDNITITVRLNNEAVASSSALLKITGESGKMRTYILNRSSTAIVEE